MTNIPSKTIAEFPNLLAEWDWEKNNELGLDPYKLTYGSQTFAHWKCLAHQHTWYARISNRGRKGLNCPYCSGQRVLEGYNDFASVCSELLKEWDYEKNDTIGIYPNQITRGSSKKVWWKCGQGHSWQNTVNARTNVSSSRDCPYCAGYYAVKGVNDLVTTNPELLKEWDYEKNTDIDITDMKAGSNRMVWWKCLDCGYSYKGKINIRVYSGKQFCPLCHNKVVVVGKNDLFTQYPELKQEWDYEKNIGLDPTTLHGGSHKKVWWKCKTCHGSWETHVDAHATQEYGCPYCARKRCLTGLNDLATVYPTLAKEYDSTLNEKPANEIPCATETKVWWKCTYCGQQWQASICSRAKNLHVGCPDCNTHIHSSFPKCAIYHYVHQAFSDAINGYKYNGRSEFDIYIPSMKVAIEYDGEAWHSDIVRTDYNTQKDLVKDQYCVDNGIKLIRVREPNCLAIDNPLCVIYTTGVNYRQDLDDIIIDILKTHLNVADVDVNIKRDELEIVASKTLSQAQKSLAACFPQIAEEWHPTLNDKLTPETINANSSVKAWWLYPVCKHEYQAPIRSRTQFGQGCQDCKKMFGMPNLKNSYKARQDTRVRRLAIPPQTRSLPK